MKHKSYHNSLTTQEFALSPWGSLVRHCASPVRHDGLNRSVELTGDPGHGLLWVRLLGKQRGPRLACTGDVPERRVSSGGEHEEARTHIGGRERRGRGAVVWWPWGVHPQRSRRRDTHRAARGCYRCDGAGRRNVLEWERGEIIRWCIRCFEPDMSSIDATNTAQER